MSKKPLDLTGKRFTRWMVVSFADDGRSSHSYWNCVCDCGTKRVVRGAYLTGGRSKSCDCLKIKGHASRLSTHKMSATKEYQSWTSMRKRCFNKNSDDYRYYGGRGISICERWSDFKNFYNDMGDKPKGFTLDRIDNNKDYSPDNCRWADRKTQSTNRRTTKFITHNGETLSQVDWSKKLGGSNHLVCVRIRKGWDERKAVSTPSLRGRK